MFVPANCTGERQPMDPKSVKDFLQAKFQEWYATEVFQKYQGSGSEIQLFKFPMSQMKPLCAQWLKKMYDNLLAHPDIIGNGFSAARITEILM